MPVLGGIGQQWITIFSKCWVVLQTLVKAGSPVPYTLSEYGDILHNRAKRQLFFIGLYFTYPLIFVLSFPKCIVLSHRKQFIYILKNFSRGHLREII